LNSCKDSDYIYDDIVNKPVIEIGELEKDAKELLHDMKPLNVDRHKSEFIHYNAITNLIKK